uniref:Chemokine interleukin-8-like domain-containing protein n=1 Tax=Seriola dumerili TaxID=41447 RepID=A0A3B4TCL2_SERDU
MRTLSFTVGLLLLLTVHHCTAMPRGLNEMSPGSCCFKLFPRRIPKAHIISIIKTHNRCSKKAYVTCVLVPGVLVCSQPSVKWARRHSAGSVSMFPQPYIPLLYPFRTLCIHVPRRLHIYPPQRSFL